MRRINFTIDEHRNCKVTKRSVEKNGNNDSVTPTGIINTDSTSEFLF